MSSLREENHLKNQHDAFSAFQSTHDPENRPAIELNFTEGSNIQSYNTQITSYTFDTAVIDTIKIVLTYLSLLPMIDIIRSNFLIQFPFIDIPIFLQIDRAKYWDLRVKVHVTIFLAASSQQRIARSVSFFFSVAQFHCIQKGMITGNASSIKVDQCGYYLFQTSEASS